MPPADSAAGVGQSVPARRVAVAVVVAALAAVVGMALPLATGRAGASDAWTIVSSPSTGDGGSDILLGSTCANAQACWAVGADLQNISGPGPTTVLPLVEKWDGHVWSLASSPPADAGFFGVTCVTSSDCWMVGAAADASGNPDMPFTEHWDGAVWTPVPAPNVPGAVGALLHSVSCSSTSDCWAVGQTTDQNGLAVGTIVLRWDGSSWTLATPAETGQPFEQLNSVHCVSASDCWAVGAAGPQQENSNFLPILPGAVGNQSLIEHFDGSQWAVVPNRSTSAPNGAWLSAVTCVASDDCWAMGSTTDNTGGPSGKLAEHWDGAAWSGVGMPEAPGTPGIVTGVTCLGPTQCWASGMVGPLSNGNGLQPTPELDAWNGSAWTVQPSPDVTAVALADAVSCVRGSGCWSVGTSITATNQNPQFASLVEQLTFAPSSVQGLVAAASDGGVFTYGNAGFDGSMGGRALNQHIVGIARTPDGNGYWEVAADGGLFAFGDAGFHGSMGGHVLNRPVVAMATTPDGNGYWEVASDGGVFAFGDAGFYGSMGGVTLRQPIVGVTAAPDGQGYWEVAADGGVFAFGSARFVGSMGGVALHRPVVGMAATPNGNGYWELSADGGVYAFGSAGYLGSVPGQGIVVAHPVAAISGTPDGRGYWVVGSDGALYTYGDAAFLGSLAGITLAAPVVGASS